MHSADCSVSSDSHQASPLNGVGDELLSDLLWTRNFEKFEGFGHQLVVKRTFLHAPRKHWFDDGDEQPLRCRSSSFSEGCASEHEQCKKTNAVTIGVDSDLASVSTEVSLGDPDAQVEPSWPNLPDAQVYEPDDYQKGYMFGCLEMTAARLRMEALQVEAEAFRLRAAAFEAKAFCIRVTAQKEEAEAEAFGQEIGPQIQAAKKATQAGAITRPANPRPAEEGKAKGVLDNQAQWKTLPADTTLSTASFDSWPTLGAASKKKKKPLVVKKADALPTSPDCVVCN